MKVLLLTSLFCIAASIEIAGQGSPQLRGIVESSSASDSYDSASEDVPAAVYARIAKKP